VTPYVHGESEEIKRAKIALKEFSSKCIDFSVNMKEVEKAYRRHIKTLKEHNKKRILYEKKYFKDIKKDYYKYISKEEQKEMKRVSKNCMQALEIKAKVFKETSNAMYKLAKVNRSKSQNVKEKIEKATKDLDIAGSKISVMLTKLSVANDEYNKVYDNIITKNIKEILRKKFNNKNNANKQIECKRS
jgi:predicted TIM-barrel fold metal-dependent hydrolase